MRYQLLGRSGLRVSEICLGAGTFGPAWAWGLTREESRAVYDAFRETGGNFIDTADIYSKGESETFLGEFMREHRDEVVLATKFCQFEPGRDPNAAGNGRKNMVRRAEESLRRLQTDHIDLYWLHLWDGLTPVEEVMRAFDDLVRAGKVRYVGVSNAPAWWVARANTLAEWHGWSPFVGMQYEYNLLERSAERELLPAADALGLTMTAWSPLANGLLGGKYRVTADGVTRADDKDGGDGKARLEGADLPRYVRDHARVSGVIDAVGTVARELERPPVQVALAWLRQRPKPVIPIVGTRRLDQLATTLGSVGLRLSDAQLKTLDDASAVPLGVPFEFLNFPITRDYASGGMHTLIDA